MTALDTARSRPRSVWIDARFFLGLVLIAASVAGVWFVVSASRQTTPVFAAARTLVPGQVLADHDLRIVDVALGPSLDAYLAAGELESGLVATRTVEAGEIVPADAVGDAASARTTSVVVRSSVDVPASIVPGSAVEVWAAPRLEHGDFDTPRILVADAIVVSVTRDESMIGGGAAGLELVIPRADVAATLDAMAGEAALSVVASTGTAR